MKDIYIADLNVGQEFMGYFMVRQLAEFVHYDRRDGRNVLTVCMKEA
jgi:hypothetical protein